MFAVLGADVFGEEADGGVVPAGSAVPVVAVGEAVGFSDVDGSSVAAEGAGVVGFESWGVPGGDDSGEGPPASYVGFDAVLGAADDGAW